MTGDSTVEKIVRINVDYKKAIVQLGEYRNTLDAIKAAEKQLKEELKSGAITSIEYGKQMSLLNQQHRVTSEAYRVLTKEIQNNIRVEKQRESSLISLRSTLSNLTKAYDSMSRAQRNGTAGLEMLKKINEVTTEIKEAEKATQRFYRNVGNYQDALKGINEMTAGFKSLGGVITGLLGGLGMEQFTQNMLETAREFEDAIARVRSVADPMMGDFGELRDKAMELGRTTRYTASQVANGMEELARKGLNTKETLTAILPTLQLAGANVVSIAEAAQVSSSTMRAFGKDAADLAHINDVLSSACAHSATNITLIGEAMKTAGPTAHVANVSLEETTALIGSLANVGMTGSDAGTGVKQVILALTKAATTKKGMEILKKYNLEFDEMRIKTEGILPILKEIKESGLGENNVDMMTLVGKYAEPRMANLVANIDEAMALNETLKASMGENARMFDQSIGNTSNAIYTMQSAWQGFMIDVYDSTSDYIVKPINAITEVIRFLGQQIDFVASLIVSVFGAMATAPILSKLGAALSQPFQIAVNNHKAYVENLEFEEQVAAEAVEMANNRKIAAEQKLADVEKIINAKKLQQEEAYQLALDTMGARRVGESEMEYEERLRLHQAYVARVNAIDAELTEAHGRTESLMTQQTALANEVRTADAVLSAKTRELADAQAATSAIASQSRLVKWSKIGVATIKGAFVSLGASIKAVWNSFAPFLALTVFFEVGQAIWRWVDGLDAVDKRLKAIDEKVNTATHNATITQLELLHKKLRENHKDIEESGNKIKGNTVIQNKFNDAKKRELELMHEVNSLLGTQLETYDDMNAALTERINLLIREARIRALQDVYSESFKGLQKIAIKYELSEEAMIDPDQMAIEFNEKVQDKGRLGMWWAATTANLGASNIYSDAGEFVGLINEYRKSGSLLTDEQKMKALGLLDDTTNKTQAGAYKKTEYTDPAGRKKTESDWRTILNALKKYRKELRSLEADAYGDEFVKMELKIRSTFLAVDEDISTFLETNKDRLARLKARGGKFKSAVEELMRIFSDAHVAASQKADKELNDVASKRIAKLAQIELEGFQMRLKLMEDFTTEYNSMEKQVLDAQQVVDEQSLYQRYLKGEFGEVKKDYSKIYENYRKGIQKKYDNGEIDREQYNSEITALNETYAAEAKWYNMRGLLFDNFAEDWLQKIHAFALKRAEMENQNRQNILDTYRMECQERMNIRADYFKQEEFASVEYWNRVRARIGEEAGEKIRLDYELAKTELANIEQNGRDKNETEEAYQSRLIAARQKLVDIHTNTNDAIEESDRGRYEAFKSISDGIIGLMEKLGEEDKEIAKMAKIIALAQIAIDTGVAISNTVREASKILYPANIPIIAGGIATVMANITAAITAVKSAKFARGAVNIGGAGTATSDSIPARISRGESVMNAKATKMFEPILIAMNNIGNGVALPRNNYVQTQQTADMTEAFTTAVANVRPVVDVREITRTQNRVETLQNLDTY